MKQNNFYYLGEWVYRFRIMIILAWLVIIGITIPFLPHIITPFKSTGFIADKAQSTLTKTALDKKLGYDQDNRFIVLYTSKQLKANEKEFQQAIKHSLFQLKNFSIQHEIIYPKDNPFQISKDKHAAYAVIIIKSQQPLSSEALAQLKTLIKAPENIQMTIGGKQIFTEGINQQTQDDLYQADMIAAPVAGIVLLLILGTVIAMLMPICLGGGCALIILTSLYFLGHIFTLSIFTLNLALLLGLCLSLDYALFIIFRFRSELNKHLEIKKAVATTSATAGRAIFFSGVAVFISLSALLLFPINILFSIGIGGLVAVSMAVLIALTLLPALLGVIGKHINRLAVRNLNQTSTKKKHHFWRTVAKIVVHRPVLFLSISLSVLLCLSYPVLHVHFGISDFKIVPKESPSRHFFDEFQQYFHENELAPIIIMVSTQHGAILDPTNITKLYRYTEKIQKIKGIHRIDSIVSTSPKLSLKQYQALYQSPAIHHDVSLKKMLRNSTGKKFTVIRITSDFEVNSKANKQLIDQIQHTKLSHGLNMQMTGVPVQNFDVMKTIRAIFPYAVAWVMGLTYLSLLILLRSIFLPLKAIFMNIMSLAVCYGVLVFIFQEGHFYQLLHFEPQGMLDITLIIIIFCAIFGFSMDYEVFLLTRIQEHYQKTKNNKSSIIFGIDQSSRIITSAALIVICICGSFMTANVLMVKEFGLGIAIAIGVDAFAIRSILVPSTMVLLKNWNWYIPKWLDKLLP